MSILAQANIFLTGGTGSFGQAFVSRALMAGARRIVIFSRDELKQAQMRAAFADDRLRFFLGDVRDANRLSWAMEGANIVVHAAAMKRIEACEANPVEAVETNITGTRNVALAAINRHVRRAILLSTDKAPVPHTLYGMTKAVAERLWTQSNVFAAGTATRLAATRYGNVLASRGSVIEVWRRQVAAGEPLTVTSETATRFWMTLPHAVSLVEQALTEMRGGEIFIPKCGSAAVLTLARAVAEQPAGSTYFPGHVGTGLLPGERRHETLISEDERALTIDRGTHYVIAPAAPSWGDVWPVAQGIDAPYRSDTNPEQLTVDDLRRMIA